MNHYAWLMTFAAGIALAGGNSRAAGVLLMVAALAKLISIGV